MAELSTIARPYARAAFDIAAEAGQLAAWGDALSKAAEAVGHPDLEMLLGNPQIAKGELAALVAELAGAGEQARAFFALLAERGRLVALPAIAGQFDALRAEAENRADVEVVSAVPLSDAQRDAFAAAMQRRLGRDVVIHQRVDESLIGGAVVRAGDLVIDGSVKGRLSKLMAALQ